MREEELDIAQAESKKPYPFNPQMPPPTSRLANLYQSKNDKPTPKKNSKPLPTTPHGVRSPS